MSLQNNLVLVCVSIFITWHSRNSTKTTYDLKLLVTLSLYLSDTISVFLSYVINLHNLDLHNCTDLELHFFNVFLYISLWWNMKFLLVHQVSMYIFIVFNILDGYLLCRINVLLPMEILVSLPLLTSSPI